MREKFPIKSMFLSYSVDLVQKWSHRRNPKLLNCVEFATTRSISTLHPFWTSAYQWATSDVYQSSNVNLMIQK